MDFGSSPGVPFRGPWALGRLARGCKKVGTQDTGHDLTRPWAKGPANFSDCLTKCSKMSARKVAKWSLKRSQRDENDAKTAAKDSQTKPRGPQRDLVEKRISF